MADTSAPNIFTVDAQGRIGANFSGHVHAAGVDLDASEVNSISPAAPNRVSWQRKSDGALVADVSAYTGPDNTGLPPNIGQLLLQAQAPAAGGRGIVTATAAHSDGTGVEVAVIDSDGGSRFPQLAGSLDPDIAIKRLVARGSGSVHFAASTVSNAYDVLHGLGALPVSVQITAVSAFALSGLSWFVDLGASTATTFRVRAGYGAAITSDIPFMWHAET